MNYQFNRDRCQAALLVHAYSATFVPLDRASSTLNNPCFSVLVSHNVSELLCVLALSLLSFSLSYIIHTWPILIFLHFFISFSMSVISQFFLNLFKIKIQMSKCSHYEVTKFNNLNVITLEICNEGCIFPALE